LNDQASITLAQEDIETGSPRAKNVKKINLPDELIKQLVSANESLNEARRNLEGIANSVIKLIEK